MQQEWAHEMRKYMHGDEIIVPPGKYFAMGDNRDRSLDSRYWGFVDRDAIMGRPFLIYWSVDAKSADYNGESTFWSRLSGIFETLVHLPSRTRWRPDASYRALGFRSRRRKHLSNFFSLSGVRLRPTFFAHDSAKLPSEMTKLQKWWKLALAIIVVIIALQAGVSLLARTHRVHAYLVARLERAFGRQVDVVSFDARILPTLQLDANGVTVGEDPAFGHEYFLRLNA